MFSSRAVLTAVLALTGINAIWGMSFPLMKSLNVVIENQLGFRYDESPLALQITSASFLVALRFTAALALLFLLLPKLFVKTTRTEWTGGFWIGLFFYLGLLCQVIGLSSIPASRSGFLTSLTAVYTPLLSAVLLKQRLSWQVICGSFLALVGVGILADAPMMFLGSGEFASTEFASMGGTSDGSSSSFPLKWGDLWTTLGALFFSGQVLLVDYYGKRYRSVHLTPGMFLIAGLGAWVVFAGGHFASEQLAQSSATNPAWRDWMSLVLHPVVLGLVLFLALFGSVVTFLGMNKFQPYLTAGQASIVYSSEPVFASCWAMVLPGLIGAMISTGYVNEGFTWQLGIGGLLILIANVVAIWPKKL